MLEKNRLLIHAAYDDAVFGRVACNCGSSDCDIDFVVEDDEYGVFSMILYKDIKYENYIASGFGQVWWRIKSALKILFQGSVKAHANFILDEENLDAFSLLVNETQNKIYKFKQGKLL
jgi:hypothetical protein